MAGVPATAHALVSRSKTALYWGALPDKRCAPAVGDFGMATRRKSGRFWRMLMLAATVSVFAVDVARPQELSELDEQILANPGDVELNLRYARIAEESGQLRHALAAYERVLINHPDNVEARRGYTRVRRALEPTYTAWRLEVGGEWDSNPLNVATSDEEAASAFVHAAMVNENRFGNRRWRTNVDFDGEVTPDFDELNYAFIGARTGPMMDVGPNLAAIPQIGVGASSLDGEYYFGDVNVGVTLEGQSSGTSYWARVRGGWREFGDSSTAEEGPYAELAGGLTAPGFIADNGTATVVPWVRWSDIEGSVFNFIFGESAPGQFVEYGVDANYTYRFNDALGASVGVLAYERQFTEAQVFLEDREDTYVSPQASVMLYNALPCSCTLKLTYRHRDNSSNDPLFDYDADQVSLSVISRF